MHPLGVNSFQGIIETFTQLELFLVLLVTQTTGFYFRPCQSSPWRELKLAWSSSTEVFTRVFGEVGIILLRHRGSSGHRRCTSLNSVLSFQLVNRLASYLHKIGPPSTPYLQVGNSRWCVQTEFIMPPFGCITLLRKIETLLLDFGVNWHPTQVFILDHASLLLCGS